MGNLFFHLLPYVQQHELYERSLHIVPPGGGIKKQQYYFYTAHKVHQQQVPLFNCPADPTLMAGVNPQTNYAPSSYAANYLVFGMVDANFTNVRAQGRPVLQTTFQDGTGNTILFAEKYASAWLAEENNPPKPPLDKGGRREGGCHWAYFQATCHNPFFAYYDPIPKKNPHTDSNAVGPKNDADPRDGRFQIQPNPKGGCNPCLPATGHATMNAAMADGSVRSLAGGMDRRVWWARVTPAGRDRAE